MDYRYTFFDLDSSLYRVVDTLEVDEPLQLVETKEWLRVEEPDFDQQIRDLIVEARHYGEDLTRRAFATQTWNWNIDYRFPNGVLVLPRYPVQSVVSVSYYSDSVLTVLPVEEYLLDGIHLDRIDSWPDIDDRLGSVKIQFVAGHNEDNLLPQPLIGAMKEYITFRFAKRLNPEDLPKALRRIFLMYRV